MKNVPKLRFKEFSDEYKIHNLDKLGEFRQSKPFSRKVEGDGEFKYIHYGDIHTKYNGILTNINEVPNITEIGEFDLIENGDIIFADASEDYKDLGKTITISNIKDKKIVSGLHTHLFRPNPDLNSIYFQYLTKTDFYLKEMTKRGNGISVLGISKNELKNIKFSLPQKKEQDKIANFFSKIDDKINYQLLKIENMETFFNSLLNKIFSQEFRFKDENGNNFPNWENQKLGYVIKENIIPVTKPDSKYFRLGVRSHGKGVFHEQVINPEYINVDTLYMVQKNNLIVNITFAWEHAIAITNEEDEGKLVSHRFPTYKFKKNQLPLFYKYLILRKRFKYELEKASPGGAGRNRVLNKTDFKNIDIMIPSIGEQEKIANFLSNIEKKIIIEKQKLEQLRNYKKGLLQKMFV